MSTARRSLSDIAKKGPPRPAKLSHIVVRTGDVARLKSWYLTLLTARVSFENESLCFMTYDDEHHRLGIVQLPGVSSAAAPPSTPGLEHVSFTYADLGQLLLESFDCRSEVSLTGELWLQVLELCL